MRNKLLIPTIIVMILLISPVAFADEPAPAPGPVATGTPGASTQPAAQPVNPPVAFRLPAIPVATSPQENTIVAQASAIPEPVERITPINLQLPPLEVPELPVSTDLDEGERSEANAYYQTRLIMSQSFKHAHWTADEQKAWQKKIANARTDADMDKIRKEMQDDINYRRKVDSFMGIFQAKTAQWIAFFITELENPSYKITTSFLWPKSWRSQNTDKKDREYSQTILGGIDSWTSSVCKAPLTKAKSNGAALSFLTADASARIEGEKVQVTAPDGTTNITYKISWSVIPLQKCHVQYNVVFKPGDVKLYGNDFTELSGPQGAERGSVLVRTKNQDFEKVCIKFYANDNCIDAAGQTVNELCNSFARGPVGGYAGESLYPIITLGGGK